MQAATTYGSPSFYKVKPRRCKLHVMGKGWRKVGRVELFSRSVQDATSFLLIQ